jgi:hypothetical protein
MLVAGVVAPGVPLPRVRAGTKGNAGGTPTVFTLSLGDDVITLDPGKPWVHADRYKWVTRGLIEEPQSFHVSSDGTVDINGEKIRLSDPDGVVKLELEINKHHTATAPPKPAPATAARLSTAGQTQGQNPLQVRFKVRLDHLGHLMIGCTHGGERVETSLRGLSTLIQSGVMLKPGTIRVDPLQRGVEIDGTRFESTEAGARQLEESLNARYAPTLKADHENAVEIRDNPASPSGFDIHFVTVRVGARFDVKGHLTQEQLDILQNPAKCTLLRPGIVLRFSPPNLIVRRKRPDGGEERIPEIADVNYLRATARQLQEFLNHPLLRRSGGATAEEALSAAELHAEEICQLQVVRDPKDKSMLWLEGQTVRGGRFKWRALTHHNIADLQQRGVFLPHLDVTLSLDNRTLSCLNSESRREETVPLDPHGSDDLAKASQMLTAALKPVKPRPAAPESKATAAEIQPPEIKPSEARAVVAAPTQHAAAPTTPQRNALQAPPSPLPSEGSTSLPAVETTSGKPEQAPPQQTPATASATAETTRTQPAPHPPEPGRAEIPAPAVSAQPAGDPAVLALFSETDPRRVNATLFRSLADRFGVAVQDVRLSLPWVFADRRFEILSLGGQEIESVLELRGQDFFGFYLSYISEQRVDFVYACGGTHIEWGPDKCVLQPSAHSEALEFAGSALLAMAQTHDHHFVFLVTPAYKQWVKPYESQCRAAFAQFLAVNDFAADVDSHAQGWVWQSWAQ